MALCLNCKTPGCDSVSCHDMGMIRGFKATPMMVEAHRASAELALHTFRSLVAQALHLNHVMNVPLDGVIEHGARRTLYAQFDSLFFAAQSLKDVLPDEQGRDWFPWMVLRNYKARGTLGLPGWMQRLIDRNEGVVPDSYTNDDVMSDRAIYEEYVEAVTRRGPYNVLTFEYWESAPKPIIHPKLGRIV